jgi:hypothetical protein
MKRMVRVSLALAAFVILCWAGVHAQGATAGQAPPGAAKPDAQDVKPAEAPPARELTVDEKAFNAIAEEKDAQKRIPLYEKFIADYPKSSLLVSLARSEVQRATMAALKTSAAKYQDYVKGQVDTAKKSENPTQLASVYSSTASELLSANVMLGEAEEYARLSVSLLDEQKYVDYQKKMTQTVIDAFNKRQANPTPAAPPAASPTAGISIRSVNGAPTVAIAPPRPQPATPAAPPRPPTAPQMPSDDTLRANFSSMKASTLATLGQVLVKREKTAEGEKVLKQAYDMKPASYTVATIAKLLAESAKKAGDTKSQFEYLTVLALSGRITADEQKDFEAAYRSAHNGSLDGIDEALDVRYRRDNPPFEVKPANRKAAAGARVVLAEDFTGAG